jgi:ceramide glucosyltransferase
MMTIPSLAPLLLLLLYLCIAGAIVGCAFTLLECYFVLRFVGSKEPRSSARPPVSILKPLHGAEPGLLARLARFCEQDYAGPVQIVFGAHGDAEPGVAMVRELMVQFPDCAIDLVVDQRNHGTNGKVSNLINMMQDARHDLLILSDSDIIVGPDYLRRISALLEARSGAVTCLYYGVGDGFWPRLSALAINMQFLPQAILASGLGLLQHCCGATIALRRSMLDRIGGFAAFANVLADDHAIGAAIQSRGFPITTAPFLVGHRCLDGRFGELIRHQIRAARTIRNIEPLGYAGTIITHPWPLAVIGALSGTATGDLVAVAALGLRLTLCVCVSRRFGLRRDYWLVPIQDMIAFAVYLVSFFGMTVHWRGSDYRVMADGMMIEQDADQELGKSSA